MTQDTKYFLKPSAFEQFMNNMIGKLADWGVGPGYMYVLEVEGRKSGKTYRTPVNLLEVDGAPYLVAPRGEANWVRNAKHAGTLTLKRGKMRTTYRVTEVPSGQKAPLLKEYLDRYASAVQRYFSVQAGSPVETFVPLEDQYPVLRLEPI